MANAAQNIIQPNYIKEGTLNKLTSQSIYLVYITIVGFIFVDLPLEQYFGTIARCPNLITAPFIFIYLQANLKQIVPVKLAKYYFNYSIISTVASLLMLFITVAFVTQGSWYVYAEFMPVKLVKAAAYNFVNALTIYNLYVLFKFITLEQLYKVLFYCLAFLTIYGLVEMFIDYPIPGIHGTIVTDDNKRLQLTTPEPVTATIVYSIFLSLVLYLRSYLKKVVFFTIVLAIVGLFLLLAIGSKGGVIFLVLSILLSIRKKLNFKVVILALITIVPIVYVIFETIVPMLLVDIEGFTSFSTRTSTWLAAFAGLIYYPIGQGFGTYLVYYPPLMIPTCKWFSSVIGIPLNTSEMEYYIQIGKYLGAKSGVPNEVMFNGIPALVYLYLICKYHVQRLKQLPKRTINILFSFIYYFIFFEFLFIVTLETTYYIFLPILLIDRLLNEYPLDSKVKIIETEN